MTSAVVILLLVCVAFNAAFSVVEGFSPSIRTAPYRSTHGSVVVVLQSSSSPQDPCWQDLYDEDCAMETLFAANYVAGEWIKKLPCAQGMEDCDFPVEEFIPEIRPESNYEEIDVMSFLNIKRATNVSEKKVSGE